jgi:hypothetical protein
LPEGVEFHLVKADKGPQAGKYVIVWVIDSVETRNRLFGAPGGPAPEHTDVEKALIAKFSTLVSVSTWGDYVVVGE